MNVTLEQAEKIVAAARKKAKEIDCKMDICVVDSGSNLVAFARMDGAWIGSVDIAIKKARTAAWFMMDTKSLTPLVGPGKSLYQIEQSNGGLITFPGGVVLKNGDEIIGAVGVSGDTVENDHAVAEAGASAL
ncbi:GlcG/HbpS family heme-binding protein [Lewinella sp. IMCC34191]|uniref:GlcG/HbpS family heme-binding protein n=1 Tax=Lewinella sp. IMCC34191 TaxID=2259172 RepID=UPI000E27016E|nr:heme-binding protein [Lewinella sp. IMCC34191]